MWWILCAGTAGVIRYEPVIATLKGLEEDIDLPPVDNDPSGRRVADDHGCSSNQRSALEQTINLNFLTVPAIAVLG